MSYMVMVEGRGAPRVRHANNTVAIKEAERLLSKDENRGRKALILKVEEEIEAHKERLLLTPSELEQVMMTYTYADSNWSMPQLAHDIAWAQLRKVVRIAEKAWGVSSMPEIPSSVMDRAYKWLVAAQKEAGL